MKLCYWRETNFGDALNEWLWPRLLPNFFDDDDRVVFIGIGSILGANILQSYNYPRDATKIVFGSGYGGITGGGPPLIDDTWKIYFVRGPRTARALAVNSKLALGDPGSLVACVPELRNLARSGSGPAFMAHLDSAMNGPWKEIAESAGLRYIDPRAPVEQILRDLTSSSLLVTEAMHGAIVADALRIPWVPFAPSEHHRAKWYDWTASIGMSVAFTRRAPATLPEALTGFFSKSPRNQQRFIHYAGKLPAINSMSRLFRNSAIKALKLASRTEPLLSTDSDLRKATDSMLEKIDQVRIDYPRHSSSQTG